MTRRAGFRQSTSGLKEVRRVGDAYDRSFAERFETLRRYEDAILSRSLLVQDERQVLEGLAEDVCAPFGLDWHGLDPIVLDTFGWTTPDGEHWRWHGRMGNKLTPVVRLHRARGQSVNTEWTAPRILHSLLADHPTPPNMRQRCDAPFVCVRLAHRCPTCQERGEP